MYQVIAATLFTQKKCHLPGLGYLVLETTSAQSDFANTQLLSPQYQVQFVPTDNGEQKFNEFSALSQLMKSQLATSGEVQLEGLGRLYKNSIGDVLFEAIQANPLFLQPVAAPRVIRKEAAHQVLVGDRSIVSGGANAANESQPEEVTETPSQKNYWWLWAIGFLLLSLTGFVVYLSKYANGLLGNMQH